MHYISYNTDAMTKRSLVSMAIAFGTTLEEIIRTAVYAYVDSVESDFRGEAGTVRLSSELVEKIDSVSDRTGMSKSKIIHLCLQKWIKSNLYKETILTRNSA